MVSQNPHATSESSPPILIKDLRVLRVLLVQPATPEGDELHQHLRRIGCQVRTCWPAPAHIPLDIDVVFIFIHPTPEDDIGLNWNADDPPAVLIAVVDYENPIIIDKLLRLRAQAVIGLPLDTFGVLATVLLSVNNHKRECRLRARMDRMNTKMKSQREIDKAKLILMTSHNISEQEAYRVLRGQAMSKRETIESIAIAVINANEILRSHDQRISSADQ